MTKLEELRVAWMTTWVAYEAARDAYVAQLKKSMEITK